MSFDITSLWVTWQRHSRWILPGAAGVALFIAGWHTGRVMSPYYASHPIVFEESASATTDSGGTKEALAALQAEGNKVAQGTSSSPAAAETSPTPQSTVAGTQDTNAKLFVGSVNSDLYHHRDCASGKRIKKENQVWFATPEAAEAAGYSPSQCTKEKEGS